ncbi:MAG: DUF4838 domain-containing protein [Candidatus Hydrogenedentes bacterium]|nr:DUF4838 domain-containing protein [Candidatus Hydrogenedentota bacterium]
MRLLICALLASALAGTAHGAGSLTLAAKGASDYVIVVAADAIAPEVTAARELQDHLEFVAGVRLPIVNEDAAPADAKLIVVGPNARFRAAFPEFDLASLRHDGIFIRTAGDSLFLAGDRPRGTLYAVYTFLEDVVGCRWWSATETHIPSRDTLRIPDLALTYVPALQCREAFYRGAFDGIYAARSKCNGHFEKIPPEYGGHYTILGWCHTFNQLLPPDIYFADHPEWYSEIDGKRVAERSQLCLTNEEMRAEFVKKALEWIRKDPESGIISISQNDWHGQCQCAKCRAVEEEEGTASGPLIRFVNAVAEEIEREFPDVLVETLAYSYTREAPKLVKPRRNVVIRLCSIECSYSQPLATGPQNETFRRDMENWSAVANQLYIWNYVTNFRNYILPHPNLRVLAPNIRFFIEHNAIALFEQGDSGCSCSDFPELRAWLLAHLMWDPSRDENELIREFMNGYYGPAAKPLLKYIELIHDAVEESGAYLRCYMGDTAAWFPLAAVNRATRLFDEAEKRVAANPALLKRVRRARMPLNHVWLNRYHRLKREARIENRPFLGPDDPVAFARDFIEQAHASDVGSWREGAPFEQYEPLLLMQFRPPGPPPEACKGLSEDDYVDVQDNALSFYRYGDWVTIVDDGKASDGKAARMPGGHNEWATQCPVPPEAIGSGPWRCCAAVRCSVKAQEGNAFHAGVYDTVNRAGVASTIVPIADVADGEYHVLDLGAHELREGMYFWLSPLRNPDQVDAVFVDRVYFMREK